MKRFRHALLPSRHVVALAFATTLPLVGACTSNSSDDVTSEGDLMGGSDASETALDAVGVLAVNVDDNVRGPQRYDACTATLIAPRVVLTSTHCRWLAAKELRQSFDLTFELIRYDRRADGAPREASSKVYGVERAITTGRRGGGMLGVGRDAMLLVLKDAVPADVAKPIAVRPRPLDESDEGKKLVVVGYGKGSTDLRKKGQVTLDSVQGFPYQRAFGTEASFRAWLATNRPGGSEVYFPGHLLSAEADEVHVGLARGGLAPGDAQACLGDSGGPLLDIVDGHYVVTGVTTGGEIDCTLGSVMTRLGPETQDAIARTIAADPPWAWAACAGDEEVDACQGATRYRCNDGAIHVEHCDALGVDYACASPAASGASCRHTSNASTDPPALDTTAAAIHEVLFASGQTCVLGGTGDVTCTGAMYPGGEAVVATDIVHIANVANYKIVGLRKDGAVLRWGGYPNPPGSVDLVGREQERLGRFTQIDGACGLRADGSVECWDHENVLEKVAVVPNATRIVTGRLHGCALRSGAVLCWGDNYYGQLGTGTPPASKRDLVQAKGITDAVALSSADNYACAVRQNGQAVCWGSVPEVCGNGSSDYPCPVESFPMQVERLTDAVDVTVANNAACFLRKGGRVSCFGETGYHAAPWERGSATYVPTEITEIEGASRIAFPGGGTCAITKKGHGLSCWGSFDVLPSIATAPGPLVTVAPVDILGHL